MMSKGTAGDGDMRLERKRDTTKIADIMEQASVPI